MSWSVQSKIVFEFFKHNGLNISKYSAQSLYCGIYDDTLAFSLGRCDEETFKKVNFLVECGASPSFIANKLLRRDSLAKYRIIPKVLDSLELHKDGEIATIYALEEWFKTTGAHSRDCEDALDMIMSMQIVFCYSYLAYIFIISYWNKLSIIYTNNTFIFYYNIFLFLDLIISYTH